MTPVSLVALLGLGCSDSTFKTYSEPPSVTIQIPADGTTVDQAVAIEMRGLVTDTEYSESLSSLTVQWSMDGTAICDGSVVDDGGNIDCVYAFPSAGDHTLRLTVTNPDGASDTAEVQVSVTPNTAPTASITLPEPGGIYYSDQITYFEALVEDAEESPDTLAAFWTSTIDGDLDVDDDPTSAGELSGATVLSEGDHLITLTIVDSTGLTGEDTVLVTVGPPNQAPDCAILSPINNESFEIGETVLFQGTATDPDVPANWLDVVWTSDRDGVLSTDSPTSGGDLNFARSDLSPGTHSITLDVTDENGADCSSAVLVTIGSGPSIEITAPENGDIVNFGEVVTLSALVADEDDSPTTLDILWTSSLDGDLSSARADSSGISSFNTRDLSLGDHSITVMATDPDGYYGNDTIRLTVNGLPSAPGVSISPDPATSADTLLATVTEASVDPEGAAISYAYLWYRNGTATGYTTADVPGAATTRGETWRVDVVGNDGSGSSEAGSDSVVIDNSAPSLSSVSISPSAPSSGDTLSCNPGAASDADGDSISYGYRWTVDGADPGVTTSTLASSRFGSGDVITCTVTPWDGYDYGDAVSSDPVEVENSAPSLSSVSLTPTTAYETTTLTCTPSGGADPDGDSVSYTYDWFVAGTRIGVTTSSLTGTWFDKLESVVCEVTPTDGSATGTPVLSNTVTIRNSLPTVASASLSPSSATESTTLTCSAGATGDADGEHVSVSFGWLVDGSTLSATGSTLTGTWFDKGDTVSCFVVPNDGTEAGLRVDSSSLVIGNTAPSLSSVSISPSDPVEGSTLTCTPAGASDADGDSVSYTYRWSVSGSDPGVTSATLGSSRFARGDSITCTVTPSDGTDAGSPVTSDPVEVGNSAPTITAVNLSPTEAYETSTLTCAPSGASDPDGDSLSYSYDWLIGGARLGLDSSTIGGAWFNKADSVVCEVTPNDGSDAGSPVLSNTVSIRNSPPTVASAVLSPSSGTESTTFYCSSGSTGDADGDAVSTTVGWKVNGALIGTSATSLTGASFDKGDTLSCLVTPNDGTINGTAAESATLTISNSAPSLALVELSPLTPYTDDDITAAVSGGTDADGDPLSVTYTWYRDDVAVSGVSGSRLDDSYTSKHQEIYVVATPSDGTSSGVGISSDVVIVENTLPTAPSVAISPSSPEPTADLVCGISVASYDLDGDALSYVYAWYLDGILSGVTSSTLDDAYTEHGDTWTCQVTPYDGDGYGPTASSSVTVVDRTAPSQPILSAIEPYRNSNSVTISGTCEPSATITLYKDCTDGTLVTSEFSASTAGTFSVSQTVPSGEVCDFYAYAEDAYGNISPLSNTVSTESCDPIDSYEDSSGTGDTCSDAVDAWTVFGDDGTSVSITGNIIDTSDSDWYVFETSQSVLSSGVNDYNFEVLLSSGGADYAFAVYRGGCGTAALECGSAEGSGWDQYDYYARDYGGYHHSVPSDYRSCYTGSPFYNNCDNLATTYYVHVFRIDPDLSCASYSLTVSNGVW